LVEMMVDSGGATSWFWAGPSDDHFFLSKPARVIQDSLKEKFSTGGIS
jgi:hypothetical protein